MIVELAIATGTSPSAWADQDAATIATALDVLEIQADRIRRGR